MTGRAFHVPAFSKQAEGVSRGSSAPPETLHGEIGQQSLCQGDVSIFGEESAGVHRGLSAPPRFTLQRAESRHSDDDS